MPSTSTPAGAVAPAIGGSGHRVSALALAPVVLSFELHATRQATRSHFMPML